MLPGLGAVGAGAGVCSRRLKFLFVVPTGGAGVGGAGCRALGGLAPNLPLTPACPYLGAKRQACG